MTLLEILLVVAAVVVALLVLTGAVCGIDPFVVDRREILRRAREVGPYVAGLAIVYLFNRWSHAGGQRLSGSIGLHITWELYELEGDVVADLQEVIPSALTGYFSFVYLFGFSFLLAFPVVAYLFHPDRRYLKELFAAYAVNYGVGAICYVLFVAYGPRKLLAAVGAPMYERYPEVVALTGAINASSNVFPSLHVSLAVTVALLARRTRSRYPRWFWIASFVAANIVVATMYLGIHWLVDVIAGVGLAVVGVRIARSLVERTGGSGRDSRSIDRADRVTRSEIE